MNSAKIMKQPFDIEIHKRHFINYLEVIILEDGTVVYASPSHTEKMVSIACKKLNVTRDELNDMVPVEYYADMMTWLCKITNCVALWTSIIIGSVNMQQHVTINNLTDEGLYLGPTRHNYLIENNILGGHLMTLEDLHIKLKELGLSLSFDVNEKLISVGNPQFANPLIWFNPTLPNNEYHGTVQIKSINSTLFSAEQIKYSLILIDTFLRTPLEYREILEIKY